MTLNVFVALQEAIGLATHWLADQGWDVPKTHGDVFDVLAGHRVVDAELAARLRSAAGLRNLIAHRYGVIDAARVFAIASTDLDDLLAFCSQLAARAEAADG